MKTAIQQMIDILQRQINHLENTQEKQGLPEVGRGALFALQSRLIDAEELLEAEKQQITEAYKNGFKDAHRPFRPMESYTKWEQYYQKTYNQEQ